MAGRVPGAEMVTVSHWFITMIIFCQDQVQDECIIGFPGTVLKEVICTPSRSARCLEDSSRARLRVTYRPVGGLCPMCARCRRGRYKGPSRNPRKSHRPGGGWLSSECSRHSHSRPAGGSLCVPYSAAAVVSSRPRPPRPPGPKNWVLRKPRRLWFLCEENRAGR